MHHHAPIKSASQLRAFVGCVRPASCEPCAHGNVTRIDVCRCGARRAMNINQAFVESSGWRREDE